MRTVALSRELEQLIDDQIKGGIYHSASEVVEEALRLLKACDELDRIKFEALKRDIAEGIEQLDRGEGIPASKVFAEMRRRNKTLRRKR